MKIRVARAASIALLLAGSASWAGCGGSPSPESPEAPTASAPAAPAPAAPAARSHRDLDRKTFNAMGVRLNLPVYWASDADGDGEPDPDEVATLLFYPAAPRWSENGAFTPAFEEAYDQLVAAAKAPPPSGPDAARQALLQKELDEAASVLVRTDLRKADAETKEVVRRILAAAALVDRIYFQQTGAAAVASKVADDAASKSVFRRNWGPRCVTPQLERNEACSAAPGGAKVPVDVYPASVQGDTAACKKLEAHPDAKQLLTPFTAVREKDGKLTAVSYHLVYGELMNQVAAELSAAADALKDPKEEPFRTYLRAAARGFQTNDWTAADEAWSKMNARNSKYYLRIGPDEVYWDPCSQKAGFHVSFAFIDAASIALQDKLAPVQQQMEDDVAKRIGAPYKARKVTFQLPDFIQMVINAGDSRDAVGATIGQSLPNWGPVANEGRGRTVAMSNLYTDPDSMAVRRQKAASLLSKETMEHYADDPNISILSTVLHEAMHNLGPAHEYTYQGKKDDQAFGGDLASMLEELKAQTGALYFLPFLRDKGVFTEEQVKKAWVDSLVWGLNHVSRGMYTASGQRKAYSQLAAVQIGFLMDEGAITWDPKAKTADGKDDGAFRIDFAKMGPAVDKLMKAVGGIKARNDKAGALALAAKYVDSDKVPQKAVTERMLRFPQPNFVYAIDW